MQEKFRPFVVAWFTLVMFSVLMVGLALRMQTRTQMALGLREEKGRNCGGAG